MEPMKLLKDRYRILQALGKGGCGETFLAVDTHLPSKPKRVIKQLKPVTTDPKIYKIIQQRFEREAAILEALHSDQIPTLHAYFTEAAEFYLVEDWIEGANSMQKVREEGIFSESKVKSFLKSLLPVLDYIHSQGIIHRDITPANIIVRERDGIPVLIDFGAVKEAVTTVVDSHDPNETRTIVVGAPGFMSPEQGAGKPVIASDLYSLGWTAIYLLTGTHPQEFIDPLTETVSWRRHATNVSSEFAVVLDNAVQWRAPKRYQTAREMLTALQCADVALSTAMRHRGFPSAPAVTMLLASLVIGAAVILFDKTDTERIVDPPIPNVPSSRLTTSPASQPTSSQASASPARPTASLETSSASQRGTPEPRSSGTERPLGDLQYLILRSAPKTTLSESAPSFQTPTVSAGASEIPRTDASSSAIGGEKGRWIYLGQYSQVDRSWSTRYLDFPSDSKPESLINLKMRVRRDTGALNVREFPFSGPVIGGLRPGTTVTILDTKEYTGSGYIWARITQ